MSPHSIAPNDTITANGHIDAASKTNDSTTLSIRYIPQTYYSSDSESSARSLITALHTDWADSPGPIEFVRFKDGITNTLFKAIKKRPGHNEDQIDHEAVLLRAYGNGTAVLIDREREAVSHSLLAKHNLAPPLLARFENGLLYRFIQGFACRPEDLRRYDIWPATARRLGQWHGILPTAEAIAGAGKQENKWTTINDLLPGKPIPNVWTVMQKWIVALPSDTQAELDRNIKLQRALEESTKELGHVQGLDSGAYVLAHCDLLSGNVIAYLKDKGDPDGEQEVSFIDYEYTTPAPAAFDLANHFSEWGGFECEYDVLPTRSQRKAFLQQYVSSYRSNQKHPNKIVNGASHESTSGVHTEDVDILMEEVDQFRGIPGLYWGIWALIQATISQIDFDYASYAETRLGEYWASRAEVDGSRGKSGVEMPLRERRWAQET